MAQRGGLDPQHGRVLSGRAAGVGQGGCPQVRGAATPQQQQAHPEAASGFLKPSLHKEPGLLGEEADLRAGEGKTQVPGTHSA